MTFFRETAFLFCYFGVPRTVCDNSKAQIAVFRNDSCFGAGNLYKDLFSRYLQPSVKKNS